MGRPKGSKNKPKDKEPVPSKQTTGKKRGRPPGSKNKDKVEEDETPRVRTYSQEEIDAMTTSEPQAEVDVKKTSEPEEPEADGEKEIIPEAVPEPPPAQAPTISLSEKELAKHKPLLDCVKYLDTNCSEQWKLHYDMMAIKAHRSRKSAILHFIGTSFGMNTGLLEELSKALNG